MSQYESLMAEQGTAVCRVPSLSPSSVGRRVYDCLPSLAKYASLVHELLAQETQTHSSEARVEKALAERASADRLQVFAVAFLNIFINLMISCDISVCRP